jgi:hypothetical protein
LSAFKRGEKRLYGRVAVERIARLERELRRAQEELALERLVSLPSAEEPDPGGSQS